MPYPDRDPFRQVDIFHVVLLNAAADTVLPELYEIFGRERMVKFLEIFAGVTIRIPSASIFSDAVRDVMIYQDLGKSTDPKVDARAIARRKPELSEC